MARCQDCGEHSPEQASFCIVCGARLIAPTARTRGPTQPAVGAPIRLNPTDTARPAAPNDRLADPAARPGHLMKHYTGVNGLDEPGHDGSMG